ncbi:hypothetical protein KVV02_007788 [Mortierella alpina]|uniref:Uncharacterized protein n=1 Tax=Mortierella alpina TaxID=64518 RepID=A0A9P8CV81_MORAP|nr:hypothetical protein KVV02_007788 [Mortierella alpina]
MNILTNIEQNMGAQFSDLFYNALRPQLIDLCCLLNLNRTDGHGQRRIRRLLKRALKAFQNDVPYSDRVWDEIQEEISEFLFEHREKVPV